MKTNWEMIFRPEPNDRTEEFKLVVAVCEKLGIECEIADWFSGRMNWLALHRRTEFPKFINAYNETCRNVVTQMKEDCKDELEALDKRYETEKQEIVNRWKAEKYQATLKENISKIGDA